jgi:hypothetical protein
MLDQVSILCESQDFEGEQIWINETGSPNQFSNIYEIYFYVTMNLQKLNPNFLLRSITVDAKNRGVYPKTRTH